MNRRSNAGSSRVGMTLIEMLVATAATLLLMGAVAQVFAVFGSAVSDSRTMIELDANLRLIAWKLRSDLAGSTVSSAPPVSPSKAEGYFEIIEGDRTDSTSLANGNTADLIGDTDDLLLFTTRSIRSSFVGKAIDIAGVVRTVESPVAEVAWFLRPTAGTIDPQTFTLYRRQLLVVGYAGFWPFNTGGNSCAFDSWESFYDKFDLSVRRAGSVLIPNTLSDLTCREARFMHNPFGVVDGTGFPYRMSVSSNGLFFGPGSARTGEDVLATNVVAFDVRVFDPAAPVRISNGDGLVPLDPGFSSMANAGSASGCYVDLGNAEGTSGYAPVAPRFSGTGIGNYRNQNFGIAGAKTYDTWSTHYESNGIDEDGYLSEDQGTNGFDDNGNGQVDEKREWETSPPYPFPLRGIEIRIRCYDPSSQQFRQTTVRHSFVPY